MGDAGGHYYAFALVKDIWLSVHGKAALAFKQGHNGIAAGSMGAYLLDLLKGK